MHGAEGSRAWRQAIVEIAEHAYWDEWQEDPRKGRTLISFLYNAISRAPEAHRVNRFERWAEEDLEDQTNLQGGELDKSHSRYWKGALSDAALFERAVIALRYLDQSLRETTEEMSDLTLGGFRTEDRTYVIPSDKFQPAAPAKRGQGFSRRGLLRHRIFPVEHSGTEIVPHAHPDTHLFDNGSDLSRKVGAAIFPRLRVQTKTTEKPNPNGGSFLVTNVRVDGDVPTILKEHCQSAAADGCDTLIWPELTMPPENVERVKDHLAGDPLQGNLPPIVVAGSWHVQDGERFYNRSDVLDGRGESIVVVDKCFPYFVREDGFAEDIEGGRDVHLIVTENELIIVLICLDFCNASRAQLIMDCDASYAFIPSMGEASTIMAHRTMASQVQTSVGTQTVVVQQPPEPTSNGAIGYVMKAPKAPAQLNEPDLREHEQFSSFHTAGDKSSGQRHG